MKIECEVEEGVDVNSDGREIPCVIVTCGECGHAESSFGTHQGSINRCLALLRENCPEGERNFYVESE